MRAHNKTEVSMIRTLIAAVENAEAVEADLSAEPMIGLNHDQRRRQLDDQEITAIVVREREEVASAVARYRQQGLTDELAVLEERLEIIDRYVEPMP
jgi:uncharacterized protein YqeY